MAGQGKKWSGDLWWGLFSRQIGIMTVHLCGSEEKQRKIVESLVSFVRIGEGHSMRCMPGRFDF